MSKTKYAVWIGRFQVPRLTKAHKTQIIDLLNAYDRLLILVTVPPLPFATKKNPLPWTPRRKMLEEGLPMEAQGKVEIAYVRDVHDDVTWSDNVDIVILQQLGAFREMSEPTILGNASTVIQAYQGKYPKEELNTEMFINMKKILAEANHFSGEEAFRYGCFYTMSHLFDNAVPVVDCVILDRKRQLILLGRKPKRDSWQFIGGFSDACEEGTYEADAYREVREETSLPKSSFSNIQYIGSFSPDDYRYRYEFTKIKSAVFVLDFESGEPYPADDIEELRWFPVLEVLQTSKNKKFLMQGHTPIVDLLISSQSYKPL